MADKESKEDNSGKKEVKEEVIEAAVTKDSSAKTGENVANPAHTEKLDKAAKEAEGGKGQQLGECLWVWTDIDFLSICHQINYTRN